MALRTTTRVYRFGCLAALALASPACITVEQPAANDDALDGEAGAEGTRDDAGADPSSRRADGAHLAAEQAEQAGAAGSGEPPDAELVPEGEGRADEDGSAGQAQSDQSDDGSGSGERQAATEEVEAQPHHYCGFIRVTTRVCNGSQSTDVGRSCVDDEVDCLALLPPDERMDYNEYCYTRIEHEVFEDQAQEGSCEQFLGYWDGDLECLFDEHCGEAERCQDNACVCPEGAACVCPNCGPSAPTCDGNVRVENAHDGGPCDENRRCVFEERRTDCAAEGKTCRLGACVDAQSTGPGEGGDEGAGGGAGDGGTPPTPTTPGAGGSPPTTPSA